MARKRPVGGVEPTSPTGHLPNLPADIADDPDADPTSAARTICLRLLTSRARTRAELAEALAQRDVPVAAATAVLDRLTTVGLIDDGAFAASFVQSRQAERGLAKREIARQLRAKGVDDELVRSAVDDIDPETERAAAVRLAERRLRSMNALDPLTKSRRLAGLLARKGYPPSLAYSVVRSVLADADGGAELPTSLDTA